MVLHRRTRPERAAQKVEAGMLPGHVKRLFVLLLGGAIAAAIVLVAKQELAKRRYDTERKMMVPWLHLIAYHGIRSVEDFALDLGTIHALGITLTPFECQVLYEPFRANESEWRKENNPVLEDAHRLYTMLCKEDLKDQSKLPRTTPPR